MRTLEQIPNAFWNNFELKSIERDRQSCRKMFLWITCECSNRRLLQEKHHPKKKCRIYSGIFPSGFHRVQSNSYHTPTFKSILKIVEHFRKLKNCYRSNVEKINWELQSDFVWTEQSVALNDADFSTISNYTDNFSLCFSQLMLKFSRTHRTHYTTHFKMCICIG